MFTSNWDFYASLAMTIIEDTFNVGFNSTTLNTT